MQSLNPFTRKTIPYHRVYKDSSDNSGDRSSDFGASPSAQKEVDDDDVYLLAEPRRRLRLRHFCSYFFVALISVSLGLTLSQIFRVEYEVDGFIAPYASPHRNVANIVWELNSSFAAEPSAENEETWASLIPKGRGFVKHPTLAKQLKSVSVFHEIHCLHGLRTAFFTKQYQLNKIHHEHPNLFPPSAFTPNSFLEAQLASPSHENGHMAHCWEYVRQALMCAADTNLEDTGVQDDGLQGAEGWGTKRVCRDFWGVKEWAERWRDGEGSGIV